MDFAGVGQTDEAPDFAPDFPQAEVARSPPRSRWWSTDASLSKIETL
jgi:hypothetical protein